MKVVPSDLVDCPRCGTKSKRWRKVIYCKKCDVMFHEDELTKANL